MKLIITSLERRHVRRAFDCGESSLNQYLQRYAFQDIKRQVSRVFAASTEDTPEHLIGYYTLSAGSLLATELPPAYRRRLPGYPVPIAVLGRLAVAKSCQGQGVGSMLLADALQRVVQASAVLAVYAVFVDALDDRAGEFYRQFGFIPLPSQPLKLFLTVSSISSV